MDTNALLKALEVRKGKEQERAKLEAKLRELEAETPNIDRALQAAQHEVNRLTDLMTTARASGDIDEATRLGVEFDGAKKTHGRATAAHTEQEQKLGEVRGKVGALDKEIQAIDRTLQGELAGKGWAVAAGDLPKLQGELVDGLTAATKGVAKQWDAELDRITPLVVAWRTMNSGQGFPSEFDLQDQTTAALIAVARQAAGRINSDRAKG